MNLEQKVCSKESALELVKMGVTVPSYFSHIIGYLGGKDIIACPDHPIWEMSLDKDDVGPAWDVAELGEMLPKNRRTFTTPMIDGQIKFDIAGAKHSTTGKTEANARALMLIWLIKEGHVDVAKINEQGGR